MALKGQGDPRWIVENRADGANVNAWHWTETDLTEWAKSKLREVLAGIAIETDKFVGSTTTVSHVEGDVTVNTRKQKTIVLYELDVTVKWDGQLTNGTKGSGTIQLPYISDERDPEDFEVRLTVEGDSREADDMKDLVRAKVIPILKVKVPKFIEELKQMAFDKTRLQLKQEGAVNKLDKLETLVQAGVAAVVAPKIVPVTQGVAASLVNGSAASTPSASPSPTPPPAAAAVAKPVSPAPTPASAGKPKSATSFSITEKFMCRPSDLFECFVEENRVKAYAGGDAKIGREKGSKFSLFGGAVQGEIVDIEPAKMITQKWRFSNWPEGLYSNVKFEFEEKNGKTILKLEHSGMPVEDKERTEQGWRSNFFIRIKGIFGFGGIS